MVGRGLGGLARLTLLALVVAGLSLSGEARAQIEPRISDGVALPSQSLSSLDTAAATFVNPANLAFMPGAEARFTAMHTGDSSPFPIRGYAADFALPFWILATGLRVDWMTPPGAAPSPFSVLGSGQRYDWVRWGAAVRLGDFAALGNTLSWSSSESPALHDLFSVATGLTLRPLRHASLAVVVRDWNTPTNDAGTRLEPSVDLGLSLRPIGGHRMLELGVEGTYHSDVEDWGLGANLAVDVPHVGTLRGGARVLDFDRPEVVANAGLEINLDGLQAAGGVLFGNAITRDATGFYASGALRAFSERPHLPRASRVVRVRFDATPDPRAHVRVMRRLWQLARAPEVEAVLLVMRAQPVPSLAHAEEMVDAIELLRGAGKRVLCHLEDAGGRELYVCSAADRVAINPAGGLRFAGLATSYFYLGGLLDKLGVRADFVRIGAHKLAPEQLTAGPSEVARDDHRKLLARFSRLFRGQVARGRDLSLAELGQRIATGPFIATEARDAGLVDALVYEDEIPRFVEEALGHPARIVDWEARAEAPEYWRQPPKIAIVYLHGDMIDGESRDVPLIGMKLAGSRTIARALEQAREDPSVAAVVFRVETGGGSSLAADVILREATLTARVKPLIVSMGGTAASGGYYAAVAGHEIYANRATLTGSIGIFYGKVDVVGLLDVLGVSTAMYRAGPRADAESIFRPFSDDERKALGRKVKQFYDLFVGRVAEGRGLSAEAVHEVGQGKVWTGEEALDRQLVDRIGGIRQALARARRLSGLPLDAPIVELPVQETTLFQRALELAGVPRLTSSVDPAWVPPPLVEVARVLAPFTLFASDRPLARMELSIVEGALP